MSNFNNREDIYAQLNSNLSKNIEFLKSELSTVRAGRANPKILDKVQVNYYGTMTPLYQMSNISTLDGRQLIVSVWDISMLKEVAKAINDADLGLTPSDDGRVIRLSFPILTEERRKELTKTVRKIGEECKISCRNCRRDMMDEIKSMKKDNLLTEDEQAVAEKEIQKILDNQIAVIDKLCQEKEKDIMEI